MRRRDRAIAGESRRTRTTLVFVIAAAVVLLMVVWFALQTLGSHSTKG